MMNELELFYQSKEKFDACIGHKKRVSHELIDQILVVGHLHGVTDYDYLSTLEQYNIHPNGSVDMIGILNSPLRKELPLLRALLTFIVRADRFNCGTGESLIEYVVDGSISLLIETMRPLLPTIDDCSHCNDHES